MTRTSRYYAHDVILFTTYTKKEVHRIQSMRHPTIRSTTNLDDNILTSQISEPPTGDIDPNLNAHEVYVCSPVWLTATPNAVKCVSLVYVDQGIKSQSGLSFRYESSALANTPTIPKHAHITTQCATLARGFFDST